MNPELEHLRALAEAIRRAETAVDAAYVSLCDSATSLLRSGEATLCEVSEASGLNQGELLDLLSKRAPRYPIGLTGQGHG
ncbi:hypothetical protein [Arthrobacter sp. 49Tsu3.1M3]|uniref:hypothetical protein n=1 Tax=Arthrobacter sp. 49Tsu3.1M3 TaxID=1279029 RepID=UPI001177723F|nr:hypothetical protein [Arthrobacter sp. 49Tsu3.1M3]